MKELFADIDPTNIEFTAYLVAMTVKKENELVKAAINSTECQFTAEVLPRVIRVTNEESGEVFGFSIDHFCNFMLLHSDLNCEIAFDIWMSEHIEDSELDQWVEAFILAEDTKEEYRAQFGYTYKKAYKYIKRNPVASVAHEAPMPAAAPTFYKGEQDGDGLEAEVALFV
jgi:hypothetical protein